MKHRKQQSKEYAKNVGSLSTCVSESDEELWHERPFNPLISTFGLRLQMFTGEKLKVNKNGWWWFFMKKFVLNTKFPPTETPDQSFAQNILTPDLTNSPVCVYVSICRTRAVSVDFSLYNINTNLLAVFSFLFEFPVSERAESSFDLLVITLWPITGLDLQLLLMVTTSNQSDTVDKKSSTSELQLNPFPWPRIWYLHCFDVTLWLPGFQIVLLALVLYFLVRGILGFLREGYRYLLSAWRLLGICKLSLAASVCGLHLRRCVMAKQQWALYLKHPRDAFTDFYPLARQSQMYTVVSAMLLFILVLKVSDKYRADVKYTSC